MHSFIFIVLPIFIAEILRHSSYRPLSRLSVFMKLLSFYYMICMTFWVAFFCYFLLFNNLGQKNQIYDIYQ